MTTSPGSPASAPGTLIAEESPKGSYSNGHTRHRAMKRIFDLVVAVGIGLLLLPVILGVAVCILLFLGRPILFRQERPGLGGRPFRLAKFRSMRIGEGLSDEQRLTKSGRILRASSLDELPTLWNVIRGDLSLVGPRPLLMQYLPLYTPQQARRHEVRPGITGLAQVSGRNALSWEQKFALDVEYVERHNLLLDMRILFLTAKQVAVRDGISHEGHATMPIFEGTDHAESSDSGTQTS